jgi:hypothetical protein
MSAKDRLLNRIGSMLEKMAAAILWKYSDPDGEVFYLEERRLGTTRSPFTGKTFTPKPVRQSLTDVAKELRSSDAKVKGALWKYVDPEGASFYCSQRLVGSVKSPFTGKTFPAKPVKFTLSEVGKELKLDKAEPEDPELGDLSEMKRMLQAKGYDPEGASKLQVEGMGILELEERLKDSDQFDLNYAIPKLKTAHRNLKSAQDQVVIAADILKSGAEHPAIKVITAQYEKVLASLRAEDPTAVMAKVQPEILELASTCTVVAKQLEERLGRI